MYRNQASKHDFSRHLQKSKYQKISKRVLKNTKRNKQNIYKYLNNSKTPIPNSQDHFKIPLKNKTVKNTHHFSASPSDLTPPSLNRPPLRPVVEPSAAMMSSSPCAKMNSASAGGALGLAIGGWRFLEAVCLLSDVSDCRLGFWMLLIGLLFGFPLTRWV